MIRTRRDRIPLPSALEGVDSAAAREKARAELFYADSANEGKSFPFKVYKDQTVKDALEQLFHGKCAYCESRYVGTQPMDVEHYRPKGGYVVNGSLEKPGYWWLAASWDNLLPSCIDCNRRRTHRFEGEEEALGKANLFPIEDEATRAKSVGEEANEVALLLHPCRDDPADFLIFPEEGVVAPLPGLGPLEQRIAEESIKVYGLGRPGLVGRRRDQRLKAESQFDAVNHRLRDFIADPDGASERRELATALRSLRSFREEKQEFALLGRHVLDPSLRKIEVFLEAKLGAELPAAPDQPESLLDRFIEAFAEAETRDPAEELDELLATG